MNDREVKNLLSKIETLEITDEYKHNNWQIKHHKKYMIFHSVFVILSVFF